MLLFALIYSMGETSMLKFIAVAVSALVVVGCQTTAPVQPAAYSPTTDARIRLYGQNQKPTILEYVQAGKKVKVNVGGSLGDAFSSFVGAAESESLGIAATQTSQNLKEYNGMLSKLFYREFVIPAGTPMKVKSAYVGLTTVSESATLKTTYYEGSCTSAGIQFTPKAGVDYEVIPGNPGSVCSAVLAEVAPDGAITPILFDR